MNNNKTPLILLIPSLAGGGAERVAVNLLSYLATHFDLTLALLEDRSSYPTPSYLKKISFSGPLSGNFAHIARIPYHIYSLAKLVKTTKAEIVLSILEQANIVNVLAVKWAGHKAVISQHVEPRRQYGGKGLLGKIIFNSSRAVYPHASQVVCVSHEIRNIIMREYRVSSNNASVIYNPVDQESFVEQAKKSIALALPKRFILHVGRMRLAHKAQDVLLSAFSMLRQKDKDISLVMVGEGNDRSKIEDKIKELNLSDSVILAGWQDNVAAIMAKAQALVLTSRYEGLPMVLVEAMSLGCPVVSTDCPTGPQEILGDSEYGLLVPVEDPVALAIAAETLLTNEEQRKYYQTLALQRAQEFSVEKIGAEYIRILQEVIA